MDKLICEATPEGKLYSDEEVKNVNFMSIKKDVVVHPMLGGLCINTCNSFSYNKEDYYDNVRY